MRKQESSSNLTAASNYTVERIEYDRLRTEILEKYHLEVLRFTNLEVDREFDAVCREIDRKVKEAVDSPLEMRR